MEISASKLKVFVTCPLQFYYNYVLRLIQPISDALLTGTRYHSIIQKYHDNEEVEFKDTKDIVTLKGLFEKYKLNPVK